MRLQRLLLLERMAALAVRTAVRRLTLSDCRNANVARMDSRAVRFFEGDVRCDLGEETDAGVSVRVEGAVAGLKDAMEAGGGMRAISRGVADADDPCGGCSSSFSHTGSSVGNATSSETESQVMVTNDT